MTGTINIDADNNLTAKKQRKSLGKPDGKRTYQKHESLDKYIEKKALECPEIHSSYLSTFNWSNIQ